MGKFVKGDIVIIPFPFSDLSGSKRRPAYVLSDLDGDDIILCQITSQTSNDKLAILLLAKDFTAGSLPIDSYIRPARIFTADKNIIVRKAGSVGHSIKSEVISTLVRLLQ